MGLWGNVKSAAEKTKLRGDIVLTKRGIIARKKKFGEEFYDCLTNDKQKLLGVSAGTLSVLKKVSQNDELRLAFERARDDIRGKHARKEELQYRLDVMEVKGSHTMPDVTIGQKFNKTGMRLSNAGTGTKILGSMKLIDREIKIRKEEFGLEVFDLAKHTEEKKKKGLKGAISKAMSGLSDQEKEIQKVVDTAKKDVEEIEGRVESLERKISILDSDTSSPN